jgi:hypothetical protein
MPNLVQAQISPSNTETPVTGIKPDRTVSDKARRRAMREKEAALKNAPSAASQGTKGANIKATAFYT